MLHKGYTIRRYNHPIGKPNTVWEECLSDNGEFCIATAKPKRFATLSQAVNVAMCVETELYKPELWIQGPRGGRYETYGMRMR